MLRRITAIAVFAIVCAVLAQTAAADPLNAKNPGVFTARCGTTELVRGGRRQRRVHAGARDRQHLGLGPDGVRPHILVHADRRADGVGDADSAKAHQPKNAVTCELPAELNTVTSPEGTFTVSGFVTGFFTPAHK